MELLSLGKEPISADQPTGSDVRYEPEFEELQAEIDKLSNPTASDRTDWKKVNKLASEILATKGKDLLVASYLAVAQIHMSQIEGLAVGLKIYRDLLEQFWDDLFPAKKRMRGRIAAIEWWLEKSEGALESLKPAPLPAEKIEEFRQEVQQIDELLQGYLDEAPLLRPIERSIDSIPVQAEKKPEPEVPSSDEKAEPQAPPKPETGKPQKVAPPAEPEEIVSEKDAQKLLRGALQTMRRAADCFYNEDLSNAQAYRWRRIAGWSMIQALPPATDGRTDIPPPLQHETIQSDLKGLKDKGNWEALLRAAEERFQGALLWLDLNRFVAEALAGLGDQYQDAHDTVCRETAYLVHRIPGIESLLFSDGTPFGDAETQQWLKGIGLGGGTSVAEPLGTAGAAEGEHMAETIQKAHVLAKKKKLIEAVTSLQQEIRGSFSKRRRLLWRLGLSQVLMNSKQPKLAVPHLEAILDDIEIYRLEDWDPDLALEGLKIVWLGLKVHTDKAEKDRSADILNRIAKLDPAEALRLGK
ncbi:MAG: type VI secretion system protein TssA [Deltaproteobacteria bacterium]|nr:type VI secretion system protein TssA [Deltaproteobacteria bacterium]